MNEAFKKSVRKLAYSVSYFGRLCSWLADALTSIPQYEPPESKTVQADFQDTAKTGT